MLTFVSGLGLKKLHVDSDVFEVRFVMFLRHLPNTKRKHYPLLQ